MKRKNSFYVILMLFLGIITLSVFNYGNRDLVLNNSSQIKRSAKKAEEKEKIVLGVHGLNQDIFTFLTDQVNKKGDIEVELKVFDGNSLPAEGLQAGDLDVIIGNHKPWIETFNKENNADFVMLDNQFAYASQFGIYSTKHEKIEDLPDGAQILIPNDPTNMQRGLQFLEKLGFLTLNEPSGEFISLLDIKDNPKNFKFTEVEVSMIAGAYKDADAALGNTSVMQKAGIDPQSYIEEDGKSGDFPIGLVVHEKDKDSEWVKILLEELNSDEFKDKFNEIYQGSQVILEK